MWALVGWCACFGGPGWAWGPLDFFTFLKKESNFKYLTQVISKKETAEKALSNFL